MKKLTIILFSILISFSSYGEWTKVGSNYSDEVYVDVDTIKKHNGYVYFWSLGNHNELVFKSSKIYNQGDCKTVQRKTLSMTGYKLRMAKGDKVNLPTGEFEWNYPEDNSPALRVLTYACNFSRLEL